MSRKSLIQTGVPIALYIQGLEQHIGRRVSLKEFNLLFSGWAYRYTVVTDHSLHPNTLINWKRHGYIPVEHADSLSNYLITGWRITRTRGVESNHSRGKVGR